MAEFSESLDSLWNVQKFDSQIVRERERIAKAERNRDKEEAKAVSAEKAHKDAKSELNKLRTQHKELEDELGRLDTRVKQLEAQGTEAGNAAAEKQRAKIDELEMRGLELLDAITAKEKDVEDKGKLAAVARESASQVADKSANEISHANEEIASLDTQRTEAAAIVVPKLMEVYEDAHAHHPGNLLTHVKDTYCGGCNGELNQQFIMQVKARAEILRCPHCARILDV